MKETVIISDLNEFALEKNLVQKECKRDKWQYISYEAGEVQGNMLVAGEESFPEKITLDINLEGWYKIYVCTMNMRSNNQIFVGLSSDVAPTKIYDNYRKVAWCATEFAQEVFWKCADMSGENIIISKAESYFNNVSCILWIKFVPMNDNEISQYQSYHGTKINKCLQFHLDEDGVTECFNASDNHHLIEVNELAGTDAKICSMEVSFSYDYPKQENYVPLLSIDKKWSDAHYEYFKNFDNKTKEKISLLHNNGIEAYCADRMSLLSFDIPYTRAAWRKNFPDNHPEYYCITRDGNYTKVMSYAYEEVQNYQIDNFKRFVKLGFDGVTLIFIRGILVGFEKPVIDKFKEKYPDLNPFLLPMEDRRLNGIWCNIMTEFIRRLSKELDEFSGRHIKINIITDYSPKTAVNLGIDVKKLVDEKIVDSVSQGLMEVYEDLDGLMDGEFINLEKYIEKNKNGYVIKRYWQDDLEKTLRGAEEYQKICKNSGVDFYGAFPWPIYPVREMPDIYPEWISEMKKRGVEKFLSWNTNHCMKCRAEYNYMSMSGHDSIIEDTYTVYQHKVLSIDGNNISLVNPNWRG